MGNNKILNKMESRSGRLGYATAGARGSCAGVQVPAVGGGRPSRQGRDGSGGGRDERRHPAGCGWQRRGGVVPGGGRRARLCVAVDETGRPRPVRGLVFPVPHLRRDCQRQGSMLLQRQFSRWRTQRQQCQEGQTCQRARQQQGGKRSAPIEHQTEQKRGGALENARRCCQKPCS